MPFPNEHACRHNDPDKYKRIRRDPEPRYSDGKPYYIVWGILQNNDTEEQAYRYPKDKWTETAARKHCKEHNGISFEAAEKKAEIKNEFHAQITKSYKVPADNEERLFIEGYASTGSIDRDQEIVVPNEESWNEAIKAYMENPILLYMHNYHRPVGRVTEMKIDPGIGFWIKAFISKTATELRELIKEKIVRAFSIGFKILKEPEIENDVRHIKKFELYEVSIVSVPSNRDALFNIAKALQYGTDLVIPERVLTHEIDDILSTKLAALGLERAELLKANKEKGGETSESPAYKNLTRVLDEIQASECKDKIRNLERMIPNE